MPSKIDKWGHLKKWITSKIATKQNLNSIDVYLFLQSNKSFK